MRTGGFNNRCHALHDTAFQRDRLFGHPLFNGPGDSDAIVISSIHVNTMSKRWSQFQEAG